MSLWADKYRPKTLSSLEYHKDLAEELKKIVRLKRTNNYWRFIAKSVFKANADFPHLLVYGPSGAGKKTRIMCILRELYGVGVERLRIEREEFQTPSNKRIEMTTIASNYHIEVNPSDAGIYDRVVIQELVKNIAQTKQLDSDLQKDFKSLCF